MFLLDESEVRKYMHYKTDRNVKATDYAIAHGGWVNGHNECYYWIRSNSIGEKNKILYLTTAGEFATFACNSESRCVRPALWIKFNTIAGE